MTTIDLQRVDIAFIDYDVLPEHIRSGMRLYIEDRCRPGSFLMGVLSNDLREAIIRADDASMVGLRSVVLFLLNQPIHIECWGSPERVQNWLREHR